MEGSSLESVALTAAFLFPILVLQKPSPKLKSKELTAHLNRRMTLWFDGAFPLLMDEGRTIQKGLASHRPPQVSRIVTMSRSLDLLPT